MFKKNLLEDAFERDIRRRYADWKFIEKQPVKIKVALKLFVETGDLRLAQRIAGMNIEDFYETIKKAKIPIVIVRKD